MKTPPVWFKHIEGQQIPDLFKNAALLALVEKANVENLHWEQFRHKPMPTGISKELAWSFVKLIRFGNQERLPIRDESGTQFSYRLSKVHQSKLSFIERYTSGAIATGESLPSREKRQDLVINGLIEEAISSSQIEGANTTRKVAKQMIELKRDPRNRDEQMILNNYRAMLLIEEWKSRPLDDSFLCELHEILVKDTMEESEIGRFRTDEDEIVIKDKLTNETVFTPPRFEIARRQLDELYEFANAQNEGSTYMPPFVKASILHFMMGYIHPFVDGNGRCARALFYWLLQRENYWMFEYIPISLQIKKQRPAYDRAYQFVETDDNDLTYFLDYKLKIACEAIETFTTYLKKQQDKANELKRRLVIAQELNNRQIAVIKTLQNYPNLELDLKSHQETHKVVYETARRDFQELVDMRVLKQRKTGKKFVFARGDRFPSE